MGNLPGAYSWNGALIRSATPCDWAVDRDYRSYSMNLLHRLVNQPLADLLLATTVSVDAEPSYTAFRWSRPPVGQWNKVAFWITGYWGFLRGALAKAAARFAGPLSYPVSAVPSCSDRFATLGLAPTCSLRIDCRVDFDGTFDIFWEELRKRKPGVLLALQSRRALEWRFQEARSKLWIVTASASSRLLAYAIFVRRDNPDIGLRRLRLIDFEALENEGEVLQQLLAWTKQRCRLNGIHVLEDVGCVLESRGIARAPYHRRLESWAYYYKSNRADLSDALRDPAAWSPSGLDGDASL